MGTGELLKLAGDYDLLSKNGHAQRTRVPIKTKPGIQPMGTSRTPEFQSRMSSGVLDIQKTEAWSAKDCIFMKSRVLKIVLKGKPRKHFSNKISCRNQTAFPHYKLMWELCHP